MVKASPMIRSFNAGEFSALMQGRVDMEFYPASMRRAKNCVLTPQGPVICRSGTRFVTPASDNDAVSELRPFVYNNEQAKVLEFASDRIRFIDEDGVQVYAPQAATIIGTAPFTLNIPALSTVVGAELLLSGFPADFNLNGEIVKVVAIAGSQFVVNRDINNAFAGAGSASLVYSVPIDYTDEERHVLRTLQDVDIMYLLCSTKRTRKLARYGDYDWRLSDVSFVDGPYLPENDTTTTLSIGSTGNAIPDMTTNTAPTGKVATGDGKRNTGTAIAPGGTWLGRTYQLGLPATDYFHAFDASDDTYWAGDKAQTGILEYQTDVAFVCTGYTIYAALDNNDTTYLNTDFSPSTFYFEAWTGSAWKTLDYQDNYVSYDNDRSVFFEFANTVAYSRYRLRILKLVRNGQIEPRVRRLVLQRASSTITITASSVVGINRDVGFATTDVGRLIRLRGADNIWRWLIITERTNSTTVQAQLQSTPFLTAGAVTRWRLGIWSDTTGWPSAGDFFGERLYLGPSNEQPNVLCGSVVGLYENFTHVEDDGTVLDDGGIVHYIRSPQLSRIKWITANERGLLIGTGSQEFTIEKSVASDTNLTQRNIRSNPSTNRGSTDANPVKVDNRVLHVPRNGRSLREFAYSYESDGYVSGNLSRFASHLGVAGFVAQAYAHEPHTIDFVLRGDETVVAVTYNRDEGIVGWGEQDFASGAVESILVIPDKAQQQDTLWLEVRREVDGEDKRYIEYLTRSWDFGMSLDDATYVDSSLVYDGEATDTIYGVQHLEGRDVYGLARQGAGTEESPYVYLTFGPITVEAGRVVLPYEVDHAVVGLGFESAGETSNLENGAAIGTAQGKVKRSNQAVLMVWDSATGEVGQYDDLTAEMKYTPLEFGGDVAEIEAYRLVTGTIEPAVLAAAYSKRGSIAFRRPIDKPLPLNIVAIMPAMMTYDTE